MKNSKDKKLKVIFISHTAGMGGSERSLLELLEDLTEYGISCHVLLPDSGLLEKYLKSCQIVSNL